MRMTIQENDSSVLIQDLLGLFVLLQIWRAIMSIGMPLSATSVPRISQAASHPGIEIDGQISHTGVQ